PTTIINRSNPATAEAFWSYWLSNPSHRPYTLNFYNQWIWEITFQNYASNQTDIEFDSNGQSLFGNCGTSPTCNLSAEFVPYVPLPFGDIWALQPPVVTSVSPTCVYAGQTFHINGTGMYPSLVSGVVIGGT